MVTNTIKQYVGNIAKTSIPNATNPFLPCELIPEQGFIWQANYYERIIKSQREYYNVSKYIWNNPTNWTKREL